jgi:hypothetical protein
MTTTTPVTWELPSAVHVPMSRWGKDHWTVLAFLETRAVDYRGMLDHDRMRCDRGRHPVFYLAKKRVIAMGTDADGARYPTRLKTPCPREDGAWGTVELPGHDDYDCLADMIREGLLEAVMPQPRQPGLDVFLDAYKRPVRLPGSDPLSRVSDGDLIRPWFVTGMSEMWLMTAASYTLTDRGLAITAELRAYLAAARNYHQFMPAHLAGQGSGE